MEYRLLQDEIQFKHMQHSSKLNYTTHKLNVEEKNTQNEIVVGNVYCKHEI